MPQCTDQPQQGLQGLAKRGRSTMGWFFGFKLHLLINHKGQIVAFRITDGSSDDRKPLEVLTTALEGKVFADKGYLSKLLPERLWQRGLHLVTGIRRNMKNYLMPLLDKVLLGKRFIMETLFDKLKSTMGLEHTRHRSRQCPRPYPLLSGGNHPGTTQDQNGQSRHS
ncbi:MAG: IS982 family transposase [Synechococcus sp. SB0669_bin_7]|nr:IS982 family transposase [Synechococcus sp. SB0669_bin_7]